jgi:hypothetical protein
METSISRLSQRYRKLLNEEVEEIRYTISQGSMEDILIYKQSCSRITGLLRALDIFDDMIKTLAKDLDEDER